MKNFQNFSIVLTCALFFNLSFANNDINSTVSFAEFVSNTEKTFNPFLVNDNLGSTTESSFAGSGFFFGDPNESLWGGSSNIAGPPDNSAALVSLFPGKLSRYLFAKDFDIDIPCNATITDITFNVTRRNNATVDAVDFEVRLFNPITLNLGAANLADPNPWLEGGSWETIAYSDATWGEAITPALLNDPRFGLVIKATNPEGSGVAQALVDAVELVICYDVTDPVTEPISIAMVKEDACFDSGSLEIDATGGTGSYEYSIDGGMNWQSGNLFNNLSYGDYIVTVRNDDGTCQTADFFCTVSADSRILQPGDAVVACAIFPGSQVTLAIEKVQAFNTFYNSGLVGTDVSNYIPTHPHEWTVDDLCGEVFSFSIDDERNIYTASTSLYDIVPNVNIPSVVSCIDGSNGAVRKIATLPGDSGAAGVEYVEGCDQLYVANLEDGIIYKIDPISGLVSDSFDPMMPDDSTPGLAPSGERVVAVTYNYAEGRLYYSMWNSDFDMNGNKNTIRSIAIDPNTCNFLPATDQLEFELPWTSEYGDPTETNNLSMPVGDIEFSADGTTMLLSEVGFDSNAQRWIAHFARVMQYTGATGAWNLNMNVPAGNADLLYEIGTVNSGLNGRGGVDFANSGMIGDGCSADNEEYIIATADALQGSDCNSFGCIYGFQYIPIGGGNSDNSVLLNIGRDLGDQQKSIYGDVDMVVGCPVFDCCPTVESPDADQTVCLDATFGNVDVTSSASAISLVYHGSVPATPDDIYTGGTTLATAPMTGGMASISMAGLPSGTATTHYVYFIVDPIPDDPTCRPYDSLIVTVRPNPTVTIDGSASVCVDDASFNITATPAPAGTATGVFSTTAAAGLTDNNDGTAAFDPTTAGSGTWEVKYIYTDDFGCVDSASYNVVVDPCLEYDLSLTKNVTSMGPYAPGSSVTYTITVQNEAGLDANNIVVEDVVPTGLNYVMSDASGNANVTETASGVFNIASITAGNSETITLMFQIDNNFMGSSIGNIAQITSDDGDDRDSDPDADETVDDLGDGVADDDEDIVTITIGQDYDLSLVKNVTSAGPYSPGSTVTYELILANEGTLNAANVEITDQAPTGLTYVNSDATSNANVTEVSAGVFTVAALAAGLTETVNVTYTIDNNFMGNSVTNLAQITADDGMDVDSDPDTDETVDDLGDGIADDDETSAMVNIGQVYDLSLTKTVSSAGPYAPGSTITYQLVLSNDGTLDATNVEVTDAAQTGLTYVSSDAASNANVTEGAAGIFTVASLTFGTTETINVTYTIDSNYMGSSVTNNVQITADDGMDVDSDPDSDETVDDLGDGIADDDEDSVTTDIGQIYDLALTKNVTSAGPFAPGSTVTYSLTLANQGTLSASNIEVIDLAQVGLTYVGSDAGTNPNVTEASAGVFVVSTIAAMTSETVVLMYTIDNNYMGTSLANLAEITIDDGIDVDSDPDQGPQVDDLGDGLVDDDESEVIITVAQDYDLSLIKNVTSAGPYGPGSNVSFQLILSNDGSINANGIQVEDALPTGLNYVGSDAASNANVTETSPGVFTVTALAAGTTEAINLDFTIDAAYTGTSLSNIAQITEDDGEDIDSDPDSDENTDDLGDGLVDDDESTISIDVDQTYDLSLVKTVTSAGPYYPGGNITYSVTVSNDGTLPANNVEITDTPAAVLSLVSDDSGTNTNVNSLGGGVYEIVALTSGNTETINFVYQIDPAFAGGSVGNQVQITEDDGDDIDSDPDSDHSEDDLGDGITDDDEDDTTSYVEITNGSIGDYVWEDSNGNGIQDGSESGIAGVWVGLYNQNGFLVSFQYTGNNGSYLFDELTPGNYYVTIDYPDGYITSLVNAGGDDTIDNDLDESNGPGTTALINLSSGEDDTSVDIGIVRCIPIGQNVWLDYNKNDVFDPWENGINGMKVELYRFSANNWVLWDYEYTGHNPDTPSDDGYFKFCVVPGMYYLKFLNPPATLVSVVPNIGVNELLDSDVTGEYGAGTTGSFIVQSGDERCDIGAGFYTMGTIGDLVWFDDNSNGIRENNEEGLEGVVVRAIDLEGRELGRATSDNEGNYMIDYLGKSTVYLEFFAPSGLDLVPSNMGSEEHMDSDVDGSNGPNTTQFYNIIPGEHMPNVDAGFRYKTLAIEYNNFFGEHRTTHNYLEWSLESDAEVSHFVIERSIETTDNFIEIGKVLSRNSISSAIYSFEDYDLNDMSTHYYRIKQVDLNGTSDHSKIISISIDGDKVLNSVDVYPNPVSEYLDININVNEPSIMTEVNVFDNLGRVVKRNALGNAALSQGTNRFKLDVNDIEKGIYNLQIIVGDTTVFKKIIVIRE